MCVEKEFKVNYGVEAIFWPNDIIFIVVLIIKVKYWLTCISRPLSEVCLSLLLGLFLVLLPICLAILVCCRSIVVATVLVPCRRCLLRRGPKGAVGQLILSEVFAHLVKSIDCPKSKLGYLNPAIVHRLSVHNYYDKMKTILLKRGCKTRTSSWRDTCLYSIEPLAE